MKNKNKYLLLTILLLLALFCSCNDDSEGSSEGYEISEEILNISDESDKPDINTESSETELSEQEQSAESAPNETVPSDGIEGLDRLLEMFDENTGEFVEPRNLLSVPVGDDDNCLGFQSITGDYCGPEDFIATGNGGFAILDSQKCRIVFFDREGSVIDIVATPCEDGMRPILFSVEDDNYCVLMEQLGVGMYTADYGYNVLYIDENGQEYFKVDDEILTQAEFPVLLYDDENTESPILITNQSKYIALGSDGSILKNCNFDLLKADKRFESPKETEVCLEIDKDYDFASIRIIEWTDRGTAIIEIEALNNGAKGVKALILECDSEKVIRYAFIENAYGDGIPYTNIKADKDGNVYQMICNNDEAVIYSIPMTEYE